MRTLYDSTTAADIPSKATMVAGYVDGNFRTIDQIHERFPRARIVTITVLGQPGANVCDTEPGNISIPHAVQWAADEVAAGRKPTLYCMASAWGDVKAAVKAHGIDGKVSYWIAQYDGDPTIPAGAVAKQYADPKITKRHYDLSAVADHWPGVDPKPAAPKSYPLAVTTRAALHLVTRRMNHRTRPVNVAGRRVLTACRAAIDHALAIKEK